MQKTKTKKLWKLYFSENMGPFNYTKGFLVEENWFTIKGSLLALNAGLF